MSKRVDVAWMVFGNSDNPGAVIPKFLIAVR